VPDCARGSRDEHFLLAATMHRARDIGLCREVMPLVERRGFYYSLATSAGIVLGLLVLRTAFASEYSIAADEFAIIAPNTAGTAAHRLGQRLLCS